MPKQWSAEELFEWVIAKTIWIFLPFYALWRLMKELIQDIQSGK